MPPCVQAPPDVPVSLQVADGTPVSLAPLVQAISSMLGSAIRSAVASATPTFGQPSFFQPSYCLSCCFKLLLQLLLQLLL